jgi:hypothetical protein
MVSLLWRYGGDQPVPAVVTPRLRHVPTRAGAETPRAAAVKAGRRDALSTSSPLTRPCLDGGEHGVRLLRGEKASGQHAQVQGRPDRLQFKPSADLRLDTPSAEFGEAAKAFLSNFGTWSVIEADKVLVKKYQLALIPNLDTQETKDIVSLSGDDLKLVRILPTGIRNEYVYRRTK